MATLTDARLVWAMNAEGEEVGKRPGPDPLAVSADLICFGMKPRAAHGRK